MVENGASDVAIKFGYFALEATHNSDWVSNLKLKLKGYSALIFSYRILESMPLYTSCCSRLLSIKEESRKIMYVHFLRLTQICLFTNTSEIELCSIKKITGNT